jgi:hypothetical protein
MNGGNIPRKNPGGEIFLRRVSKLPDRNEFISNTTPNAIPTIVQRPRMEVVTYSVENFDRTPKNYVVRPRKERVKPVIIPTGGNYELDRIQ